MYVGSQKEFDDLKSRMEYPFDSDVVFVDRCGKVRWAGHRIAVGTAVANHYVRFEFFEGVGCRPVP